MDWLVVMLAATVAFLALAVLVLLVDRLKRPHQQGQATGSPPRVSRGTMRLHMCVTVPAAEVLIEGELYSVQALDLQLPVPNVRLWEDDRLVPAVGVMRRRNPVCKVVDNGSGGAAFVRPGATPDVGWTPAGTKVLAVVAFEVMRFGEYTLVRLPEGGFVVFRAEDLVAE